MDMPNPPMCGCGHGTCPWKSMEVLGVWLWTWDMSIEVHGSPRCVVVDMDYVHGSPMCVVVDMKIMSMDFDGHFRRFVCKMSSKMSNQNRWDLCGHFSLHFFHYLPLLFIFIKINNK